MSQKTVRVEELFVFPVKACNAMSVSTWPVEESGFAYDRHWFLVDGEKKKVHLNSHRYSSMINVQLDLSNLKLSLGSLRMESQIEISVATDLSAQGSVCESIPMCLDSKSLRFFLF